MHEMVNPLDRPDSSGERASSAVTDPPPMPGSVSSPPASPLAPRLARRVVDLLVVAFLLTVGLSTGRQLVEWWRVDPAATSGPSDLNTVDLDWNRTPVTLRFGDAPTSLQRIPFAGSRKQLDEELTRIGQSIVTGAAVPARPMGADEKEWLLALQHESPVFWDSAQGNVYRRHEPLPSFVATRFTDAEADAADPAEIGQRIVGWGLAFPTAPGQWTVYVLHPDSAKPAESRMPSEYDLPPGSRNIAHLHGSAGCQWRVVQGRGSVAGWVQHFEGQFGFSRAVSRAVTDRTATLKFRRDKTVTDIQIRLEPDGRLTGVIWSAKEGGPG